MHLLTSTSGVKAIAGFEGTILHLYFDVVGIQTVCTGHVTLPGEDWSTVTREKCEATLGRDLARFEKAVNDAVRVHINQPMFDAMVSLAFNIGEEGFRRSSVVHHLNQGHYTEAAASFLLWRFARVKQKDGTFIKQPVLLGRREAEARLFRSGLSEVLLGGGYEELSIEGLISQAQERLFDLRSILDDRGLPVEDTNAYAEDGRIVALPPEREEAFA
jgi:GH24 family phage-related lysozyme (muramidase)